MWSKKIFILSLLGATGLIQVVQGQAEAEDEGFDKAARYRYAFNVADDDEQLYQRQIQQLENQVVTGEFSWVDALGTRHVTVYRADESGYHVIEMRTEVGAVAIKPAEERRTTQNRFELAKSRIGKRIETDLFRPGKSPEIVIRDQPVNLIEEKVIVEGVVVDAVTTEAAPFLLGEENQFEPSGKETLNEPVNPEEANLEPVNLVSPTTEGPPVPIINRERKIVRVIKRPRNGGGDSQAAQLVKKIPIRSKVASENVDFGNKLIDQIPVTSSTQPDDAIDDADLILPTFSSFAQVGQRKSTEDRKSVEDDKPADPKVVRSKSPVHILPFRVSRERLPIVLNQQNQE